MLDLIRDGDMRAVGGAAKAAGLARANSALAAELVDLLSYPNAAVRMRAADALEKASAQNAKMLAPHKALLLELAEDTAQKELRWHLAQLLPRLDLNAEEISDIAEVFHRWYARDDSHIVRTFVVQGIVDLARRAPELIDDAQALVADALESEAPALKARARKVKLVLDRLQP
ncbi:hypothetical protein ACFL12_06530 [Pseudomonadota bacterium]